MAQLCMGTSKVFAHGVRSGRVPCGQGSAHEGPRTQPPDQLECLKGGSSCSRHAPSYYTTGMEELIFGKAEEAAAGPAEPQELKVTLQQ